jgi:hypothetical protein
MSDNIGIKIGTEVDASSVEAVAQGIASIFKAGNDNRIDQNVIETALEVFANYVRTDGVTVNNSNIELPKGA